MDTDGTKNAQLKNPLNYESGNWSHKPRVAPLKGTEPVHGDFLVLIHCEHDPFVRLYEYDNLAALESALASNGGIVNFLITYAIGFAQKVDLDRSSSLRASADLCVLCG